MNVLNFLIAEGGTRNYSIDGNNVLVYEVEYDNIEGVVVEGIVGVGEISVMGNELTLVNSALGETLEGEDVFVRVFTRVVE